MKKEFASQKGSQISSTVFASVKLTDATLGSQYV
jgi:hypothetical protein